MSLTPPHLISFGAASYLRCRQVVEDDKLPGTWIWLSSKDGDLRDPAAVDAIFEKYQPTKVRTGPCQAAGKRVGHQLLNSTCAVPYAS